LAMVEHVRLETSAEVAWARFVKENPNFVEYISIKKVFLLGYLSGQRDGVKWAWGQVESLFRDKREDLREGLGEW